MAKIHMILQGKGGVGKSFVAATVAQYKASKGQKPLCIDTDPVNSTFHGYKALGVRRLELMDGDEINSRNFDTLVELVAASPWCIQQTLRRVEKPRAPISKQRESPYEPPSGTGGEAGNFPRCQRGKPANEVCRVPPDSEPG